MPLPWLHEPMPPMAEEVVPFTAVLLPPTVIFPFEPTFPPLAAVLLGGLVGGFSAPELKLKVAAPPARPRAPQPFPVANRPYGKPGIGVCEISCWTNRRAPLGVTARDVTM